MKWFDDEGIDVDAYPNPPELDLARIGAEGEKRRQEQEQGETMKPGIMFPGEQDAFARHAKLIEKHPRLSTWTPYHTGGGCWALQCDLFDSRGVSHVGYAWITSELLIPEDDGIEEPPMLGLYSDDDTDRTSGIAFRHRDIERLIDIVEAFEGFAG
jgi:hypothetical protein